MENTNVRQEEIRSRFFGELSLQLREKGIVSERKGTNILCVYLDGEPVCDVHPTSNVFSCEGRKKSEEANELQYETARIAHTVRAYLNELEAAPPPPSKDLDSEDGYKHLAGFGEGFEQRANQAPDGEIYAHPWSPDGDWSIQTEQELFGSRLDRYEEQKGGSTLG